MALGFDIWSAVENGYTAPTTSPIDTTGKRLSDNNSRAKNAILCSVAESIFVEVMHCRSVKEIWDKFWEFSHTHPQSTLLD